MKKILVLCTGNSCRSQMAEGYLRHFAGNKALVYSAGVETHGVNPNAIATMKKDGIDISGHTSNHVDEYKDVDFDLIITVCDNAKERCPVFLSGALQFHQNFEDPARFSGAENLIDKKFEAVRNQIKTYFRHFFREHLTEVRSDL